jgi:hypothetical protein
MVLLWAALVLVPARAVEAAADPVWGDYAQVIGKSARGSGGGFNLRWSWAEPGKSLVQEYLNPGDGSVSHREVITVGDKPGTFVLQSSSLAKKRWLGRLQGDGSVLFIGSGFLKYHYVAGLGADGNWEMRGVKLDGERIVSVVEPEKYSRFLVEGDAGAPSASEPAAVTRAVVAEQEAAGTAQEAIAIGAPVRITLPVEATSDEGSFGTRCLRIDLEAGQGYKFSATTPPGAEPFVALSQYRKPDCKAGILNDDYSHSGRLAFKFRSSGGGSYFMLVRAHSGPIDVSLEKIDGLLAVQRIGTGLRLGTPAATTGATAPAVAPVEVPPVPTAASVAAVPVQAPAPAPAVRAVEALDPLKWGVLARIAGHQGYSRTWKGTITYLPSSDGNALYELLQANDKITLIGQFQRDPATGAMVYVNSNQYRDYRSFDVLPVDGASVRMKSLYYPSYAWDAWLLLDDNGRLRKGSVKRTMENLDGALPFQIEEARNGRLDSPIALTEIDVTEVRASDTFREAIARADASRSAARSDVAYSRGLLAEAAAHDAERARRRAANARWDAVMRPLYGALTQAAAEQTVQTQQSLDRLDRTLNAIRAQSAKRGAAPPAAVSQGPADARSPAVKPVAPQPVRPVFGGATAKPQCTQVTPSGYVPGSSRNSETAARQAIAYRFDHNLVCPHSPLVERGPVVCRNDGSRDAGDLWRCQAQYRCGPVESCTGAASAQ